MSNITSLSVTKDHIGIIKSECNGAENDLAVTLASAMIENKLLYQVVQRATTMVTLVEAVDTKNAVGHE